MSAIVESSEQLDARLGYSGSIELSPISDALDEQRSVLWDAQAIIQSVAQALEQQFKVNNWPAAVPMYSRALQRAAALIDAATGALEAGVLEDRAIAISRQRDAETAAEAEEAAS